MLVKRIDGCRHGLHQFRILDGVDCDLLEELVGVIDGFRVERKCPAVHERRVWDGSGAIRDSVVIHDHERALLRIEFRDDHVIQTPADEDPASSVEYVVSCYMPAHHDGVAWQERDEAMQDGRVDPGVVVDHEDPQ